MFRALSAAALLLSVSYSQADAAEITLWSPGAVASSLRELVPQFEQASGHKVTVKYSPALALVDKLKAGEASMPMCVWPLNLPSKRGSSALNTSAGPTLRVGLAFMAATAA